MSKILELHPSVIVFLMNSQFTENELELRFDFWKTLSTNIESLELKNQRYLSGIEVEFIVYQTTMNEPTWMYRFIKIYNEYIDLYRVDSTIELSRNMSELVIQHVGIEFLLNPTRFNETIAMALVMIERDHIIVEALRSIISFDSEKLKIFDMGVQVALELLYSGRLTSRYINPKRVSADFHIPTKCEFKTQFIGD